MNELTPISTIIFPYHTAEMIGFIKKFDNVAAAPRPDGRESFNKKRDIHSSISGDHVVDLTQSDDEKEEVGDLAAARRSTTKVARADGGSGSATFLTSDGTLTSTTTSTTRPDGDDGPLDREEEMLNGEVFFVSRPKEVPLLDLSREGEDSSDAVTAPQWGKITKFS